MNGVARMDLGTRQAFKILVNVTEFTQGMFTGGGAKVPPG